MSAESSPARQGIYEALELRDGGPDYLGKSVLKSSVGLSLFLWLVLIAGTAKFIYARPECDRSLSQSLLQLVAERRRVK